MLIYILWQTKEKSCIHATKYGKKKWSLINLFEKIHFKSSAFISLYKHFVSFAFSLWKQYAAYKKFYMFDLTTTTHGRVNFPIDFRIANYNTWIQCLKNSIPMVIVPQIPKNDIILFTPITNDNSLRRQKKPAC